MPVEELRLQDQIRLPYQRRVPSLYCVSALLKLLEIVLISDWSVQLTIVVRKSLTKSFMLPTLLLITVLRQLPIIVNLAIVLYTVYTWHPDNKLLFASTSIAIRNIKYSSGFTIIIICGTFHPLICNQFVKP